MRKYGVRRQAKRDAAWNQLAGPNQKKRRRRFALPAHATTLILRLYTSEFWL
jgi:hypothetical protein